MNKIKIIVLELFTLTTFLVAAEQKIVLQKYPLPSGTTIAQTFQDILVENINFKNVDTNLNLKGIIYKGKNFDNSKKYPTIIVTGPMLSVKEHSQTIYAKKLAELGYVTMVFDYTYFGESDGQPRYLEDPDMKASDIKSAVTYLSDLNYVDKNKLIAIGICGSGGYVPHAAINDIRIKSVVSIVPFTVQDKWLQVPLDEAIKDRENYEKTRNPQYISLMDSNAEGASYYYNKDRGYRENWSNLTVTWSEETWQKYHPTQEINKLKVPYLVITSENAFTREQAQELYDNATTKKELYVVKRASHFDMYDLDPYVSENIKVIDRFLKNNI